MRVAGLLYEAVLTRCVTTLRDVQLYYLAQMCQADLRRDIYYKDVQLFKKQEVVDKVSCVFAEVCS